MVAGDQPNTHRSPKVTAPWRQQRGRGRGAQRGRGVGGGRGTSLDPPNRFEEIRLEVIHDNACLADGDAPEVRRTLITDDASRSIVNRVDSPDLSFNWSLNPYRGCEHGCVYCYARPTHEFLGLSCGLDFESKIVAKHDAPMLLRRMLASPRWEGEPIAMSGVTDPYQPIERSLRITRACLEVMVECGQPVMIVTKGGVVERDIDLLADLAQRNAAAVMISLTTLDPRISSIMEPRAASPTTRLRCIERLASAGIPTGVMCAPIIPCINEDELPSLLAAARYAGATHAGFVVLRLPHQVKDIFLDWLERHFPDRVAHVTNALKDLHDGDVSESRFRLRMSGQGQRADQIKQLFKLFCRKNDLSMRMAPLSSDGFTHPVIDVKGQGLLFSNNASAG